MMIMQSLQQQFSYVFLFMTEYSDVYVHSKRYFILNWNNYMQYTKKYTLPYNKQNTKKLHNKV